MDKTKIIERVAEFSYTGVIASFGAFANYMYHVSKGRPFKISMFITNWILGFFVGNVVGEFIPKTFDYRDGILLISGFAVWNFLQYLEIHGIKIITTVVNKGKATLPESETKEKSKK